MKTRTSVVLASLLAAAVAAPSAVLAQEQEDSMIEITALGVKVGHWMKFGQGMQAYIECYEENDGTGEWSVWEDVESSTFHIVSSIDGWAELDETDAASRACWSVIEEQIGPHLTGYSRSFARYLPEWSGEAEGYDVVRLHQFRVEEGDEFEQVVGEITSIMKEAEYEHMGAWYDVIGNDGDEIGYFVVEHFDNFAAMDEDRVGAYGTTREALGEAAAEALWERFGDTLRDDGGYQTTLLRRMSDLGRSNDED